MKAEIEIIRCNHVHGVSKKNGKEFDGYNVWVNVAGYQFPYNDFIFTNTLGGVELKTGMKGLVYLDINSRMQPTLSYRFG